MKKVLFSRTVFAAAALLVSSGLSIQASTLAFSGTVNGTAVENPQGSCAPFITVNATGSGSSNLLGSFTDVQSHCTTSLTTFDNGVFTLTSQSTPGDSLFGIYAGTASVGSGGVLDFSALLSVNGGSGSFAGASGTLNSSGTLAATGAFTASFSGSVNPTPEPATFLPALGVLALLALLRVYWRSKAAV